MKEDGKLPEYTKRAMKAYRDRNDILNLTLPAGTKEALKSINPNQPPGATAKQLLLAAIEQQLNI